MIITNIKHRSHICPEDSRKHRFFRSRVIMANSELAEKKLYNRRKPSDKKGEIQRERRELRHKYRLVFPFRGKQKG